MLLSTRNLNPKFDMLPSVVSFLSSDFSPILVPLQSAMTVTLPSGAGSHRDHNPFPGSLACIVGFEDTVSNAKTVTMVIYFVIERRILHRQDLVGFDAVANLWGSIPQPSLDGSFKCFCLELN